MSAENHRIHTYQYELSVPGHSDDSDSNTYIFLYGSERNLLCIAIGCAKADDLGPPREAPEGHVVISVHRDDFSMLIDMLRNEKPLYFSWSPETQRARLTSNKEPVGEQERRKLFAFLTV